MKIGILTYHRSRNYGAFLQACALCYRLNQEEDIQAEIIDFNMKSAERFYSVDDWSIVKKIRHYSTYTFKKKLDTAFQRGIKRVESMLSKEKLSSNQLSEFQDLVRNKYDVIIAGSDEIWKLDGFRKFPNPYWLIGDLGCRKFSYAASSRTDLSVLSESDLSILCDALNDFEYISVRDMLTYREVEKAIGASDKITQSCDPSFLYDFPVRKITSAELLGKRAKLDPSKKNIVVMLDEKKVLEAIKDQLASKYNLIAVFHRCRGYISIADLDQFEWLELIANADMVLSSFFHGICFSIVNQTPFVAIGTKQKRSKLDDLLLDTEHGSHYIFGDALRNADWNQIIETYVKTDTTAFVQEKRDAFTSYLNRLRGIR